MSESPGPDPDDARVAVFVYGTLRPGRANWPVAAPWCAAHEPAVLAGFGLYSLAYPVVAPIAAGAGADDGAEGPAATAGVRGELLWLHPDRVDAALGRLDAFEGVDRDRPERSYYERTPAEVVVGDGSAHRAWVYVPGPDLRAQIEPARRVPGDDWPA